MDPTGAVDGPLRVYRGGSWYYAAAYVRAANRGGLNPGGRDFNLGLRLLRTSP